MNLIFLNFKMKIFISSFYLFICLFFLFKGMYCLGGVTDSSTMTSTSPSNVSNGNRDCILSVVRALGVLICEGRIQGSPRGYREGPHCAAPLQSPSNQHLCKKDDYLVNKD